MKMIELKIAKKKKKKKVPHKKCVFNLDVLLIISGLPQVENEDLMAEVKDLLCEGLQCDPVPDLVVME